MRGPVWADRSGTVASTVRRACRRAGIAEFGSHRLRHTAACEMVRADVPLVRIGQVLRHRSLQSTAIYARVDVERLRRLAPPWPGGAQHERAAAASEEYLRLRRALGFKLESPGRLLPSWSATWRPPARARSSASWRSLGPGCPSGVHPNRWAERLRIARGFAAYLQDDRPDGRDPAGRTCSRFAVSAPTPYLWSRQADICRLLAAARRCVRRCARRAMRRCSGCWP